MNHLNKQKVYTRSFYAAKSRGKALEGGRSRTAQRGNLLEMLQAKGKLENAVSNEFGRNLATRLQGNKRMAMNLELRTELTLDTYQNMVHQL